MEKSANIQHKKGFQKENDAQTCRCPICFNTFLPSNIQSHAATCNGNSVALENRDIDKTELNENGQSKNSASDKKAISSFFKPPLQNKHPLQSIDSTQNEISVKKLKMEGYKENNSSMTSKKDSNCVRRPLADVMRPTGLEHYKGQEDVVGDKGAGFWRPLFQSISKTGADIAAIPSMLFWGPPGCGKTSLANVFSSEISKAQNSKWRFTRLSACNAGVAQVKDEVAKAKNERTFFKRSTILFIDEIHRFNKTQQDALLPHVEDGTITLIGATTENPSFSINSALLSRCRVIVLNKLAPNVIFEILLRALDRLNVTVIKDNEENKSKETSCVFIEEKAVKYLSNVSDGDARAALNCLEISLQLSKESKTAEKRITETPRNGDDLEIRIISIAT